MTGLTQVLACNEVSRCQQELFSVLKAAVDIAGFSTVYTMVVFGVVGVYRLCQDGEDESSCLTSNDV